MAAGLGERERERERDHDGELIETRQSHDPSSAAPKNKITVQAFLMLHIRRLSWATGCCTNWELERCKPHANDTHVSSRPSSLKSKQ